MRFGVAAAWLGVVVSMGVGVRATQTAAQVYAPIHLGATDVTVPGDPISIAVKDGDLGEVLRLLARVGRLNLVLDPAVAGRTLTLTLEGVPWNQVLDIILTSQGFASQLDGNVLRVAPAAKLVAEANQRVQLREARELSGELRTIAVPLSNTNATQAEAIIRKSLTARGTTSVDRRTNTLFITDVFPSLATSAAQLTFLSPPSIDVPAPQAASFDVRLLEVEESLARASLTDSRLLRGARIVGSARLVLGVDQQAPLLLGEISDGNAVRMTVSAQLDGSRVMLVVRAAAVDPDRGTIARALNAGQEHAVVVPGRAGNSASLVLVFSPL